MCSQVRTQPVRPVRPVSQYISVFLSSSGISGRTNCSLLSVCPTVALHACDDGTTAAMMINTNNNNTHSTATALTVVQKNNIALGLKTMQCRCLCRSNRVAVSLSLFRLNIFALRKWMGCCCADTRLRWQWCLVAGTPVRWLLGCATVNGNRCLRVRERERERVWRCGTVRVDLDGVGHLTTAVTALDDVDQMPRHVRACKFGFRLERRRADAHKRRFLGFFFEQLRWQLILIWLFEIDFDFDELREGSARCSGHQLNREWGKMKCFGFNVNASKNMAFKRVSQTLRSTIQTFPGIISLTFSEEIKL